jgi:hypothetical protein
MKCIRNKKTGDIVRVADKTADSMVGITWEFVSKDVWRKSQGLTKDETKVAEQPVEKKSKKEKK